MELPNKFRAYIPTGKITGYLLSETHAVGKSKARFFRSFGFDEAKTGQMEQALMNIAQTQAIEQIVETPHGIKYIVDGALETPKGIIIRVRTIWIVETGEDNPRFVTAYPRD